jgi:(p)ppGpp synthase/HD superfamily hydrolase
VSLDQVRSRVLAQNAAALVAALRFAAQKHSGQRRKDPDASPYVNHPIAVAEVLARVAGVTDLVMLQAAIVLPATIPRARAREPSRSSINPMISETRGCGS